MTLGSVPKQLSEHGKSGDVRHCRTGGKPVLAGILDSRLRGSDVIGNREVISGLLLSARSSPPNARRVDRVDDGDGDSIRGRETAEQRSDALR